MAEKPQVTVENNSPNEEPQEPQESQEAEKSSEDKLWEGIDEDHPVRQYVKSLRDENAEKRVTAKSVREENESLQASLKEAKTQDDIDSAIAEWQQKVEATETQLLRERVASRHKIPEDMIEFLTATTEDDLVEQAKKLAPRGPGGGKPPEPNENLSGGRKPREETVTASDHAKKIREARQGKKRRR